LEDLGHSLEEDQDFSSAEAVYRTCQLQAQGQIGSDYHRCTFMLARVIVASRQTKKYAEAEELLVNAVNSRHGFFNSELFDFAVLRARFAWEQGDKVGAARYARRALDLAQVAGPQLPRHPTVGLVRADPGILTEMFRLASG
jgi:hypothetical protein